MKNRLAAFEVADYSPDFITNVIGYVTRWSSRGEVLDKAHITYLQNYLKELKAKTVVFESDYVDRHYLEDYSEYYARCFQALPKTCARLHFFRTDFTEAELTAALNNRDNQFIQNKICAENAYVGFIVIRPLPITCIARMCLTPYDLGDKAVVLRETVNVSLFGIDLKIETAPFIEQDKVVSACATSAIWVLLSANRTLRPELLPSPSAITKSALLADRDGARAFPASRGLKVEHVCRSLKSYQLEPIVIDFAEYEGNEHVSKVQNILAAYLQIGIPVLIGGTVSDCSQEVEEPLGEHLVCALGYKSSQPKALSIPNMHITKVYVHDDRYGPYVALTPAKDGRSFNFELMSEDAQGQQLTTRREKFTPKVMILGVNHKIRIDYEVAFNITAGVHAFAKTYVSASEPTDDLYSDFSKFSKSTTRVELTFSSSIKRELISDLEMFSFNGTAEPAAILATNMPKYMWRCRYIYENSPFADILIDATGVPQGDLVIGYIAYNESADACWRAMGKLAELPIYKSLVDQIEEYVPNAMGCITRFFREFDHNYLDAEYGPLRVPARKYRPSEIDGFGDQVCRIDATKIVRGNNASLTLDKLNKSTTQLWVIDEFGDMIIGDEPEIQNKMGHPALTGGVPARLGGELHYQANDDCWEINSRSGTYSTHLRNDPHTANRYLQSVIERNLHGCKVRIAAQQTPGTQTEGHQPASC